MDGISFDVNRGEIYCLVGESGCGKTTTGKALVSLVDATEGDVFLEMPDRAYQDYEDLSVRETGEDRERKLDELRRNYSMTWRETARWTPRQYVILGAIIALGFLASLVVPALGATAVSYSFNDNWVIVLAVVTGALLGGISILPPARPANRTAAIVAILGAVGFNLIPVLSARFSSFLQPGAIPFDVFNAWAMPWGANTFGMLLGQAFAPVVAGGVARALTSVRQDREGFTGIKMRKLRRRLHMIFQDPYESLNPKQSVFEIVEEPLKVNRVSSNPGEITALVQTALEDAGLRPAEEFMFRFPHELSGGQRQRVSIAAALVLQPDFIVADEPVSMLDVSIRTEILQLMLQLRKERNLTYLFITHDLGLAWILADRVAVMYLGKIVESGTAEQVIAHPRHPYTQALISVVPSPDPRHIVKRIILRGERPDPVDIPTGCRFHPRCPVAFERCGWNGPEVAGELQTAVTGRKEVQGSIRAAGTKRVIVTPSSALTSTGLAEQLRRLVADQRDTRLAFRAVDDIRTEDGAVILELHDWTEPELVELSPGNQVACHLVSANDAVAPIPAASPAN